MLFSHVLARIGVAGLLLTAVGLPASAQTASAQTDSTYDTSLAANTPLPVHPWQAVLDADFAMGPSSTPLYTGALGINYLIDDNIRIGVANVGLATTNLISGTRYGLSIAPTVGYYGRVSRKLEGSIGIAVPVQWRFGADLDAGIGTMPYAQAGLDLFFDDHWSLGLIERAGYVLSDAYILSSHALPQHAVAITTGLAFKAHF